MRLAVAVPLVLFMLPAFPGALAAQGGQGASDRADAPEIGALVRVGAMFARPDPNRTDGFELYDARLGVSGEIGLLFEYDILGAFDPATNGFELLDARLIAPVLPADGRLELGQFKAPVGREQLQGRAEITFVERAQISRIVPPGRQVGAQVAGELMEGRMAYRAGIFNGNGTGLANDGDDFMYAGRLSYNSVGSVTFYDDFLVEVGASFAFSRDSAVDLSSGGRLSTPAFDLGEFTGDRTLWGVDLGMSYLGFFLTGEYLRGDFDPDPAAPGVPGTPESGLVADGAWIEAGYDIYGAAEVVLRYDGTNGFLEQPGSGDFLLAGFFISPGYFTRVGFQYVEGLDGAERGFGLADGQFAFLAQASF